jgi:hypothetical protein
MTANEVREYLTRLREERAVALEEGLDDLTAYMADLDEEIAHAREAYVAAAVTEIASLRGELFGSDRG